MRRVESMPLSEFSYRPKSLDQSLLRSESTLSSRKWTTVSGAGEWISRQWKETIRDVVRDARSARSWKPFLYFLYLCWLGCLLYGISYLASSPNLKLLQDSRTTACQPDDSLSPYVNSYNAWDSSGFFQITLAFGSLTFTQAKVIDICWDVFVGRIGQATLAVLSWHVFSQYVTTSMDRSPVTFRTFWVIFLHREPTFTSLIDLTKDFISRRRLNSIIAMVFMITTMIFVLIFPTFSSAMTGYAPLTKSFIQIESGRLVPFSDFRVVAYVIHDGFRINMTADAYVTRPLLEYYVDPIMRQNKNGGEYYSCTGGDRCKLVETASKYTSSYGFYGNNDVESKWGNTKLPAPTLNISAYYIPRGALFGNNWTDPQTQQKPFSDPTKLTYLLSNQTYSLDFIDSYGSCQPVLNEYQWGFSFIQLFIITTLTLLWTVGLSIMWLKAHFKLPLRGYPETPKGWKAVILLAEAMNIELTKANINTQTTKDRQVKKEIREHLRGGSVTFDSPLTKQEYSFKRGLWSWLKTNQLGKQFYRNKWWWIALLAAVVPLPPTIISGIYTLASGNFLLGVCCGTIFGILVALAFGSTTRSRLFMLCLSILCGLIVFIGLAAAHPWQS